MSTLAKEKSEISETSAKIVNNSSVNSSADDTNLQPVAEKLQFSTQHNLLVTQNKKL